MDKANRQVVMQCLVGSHNYNLNTPESDMDYKIFVCPTFDDLYTGNSHSESIIGHDADFDFHDIRKMDNLLYKANVNFLEVLFSQSVMINPQLQPDTKKQVEELFNMKHDIAKMNLPYLYHACIGMHHNKMKYLEKGTSGTQHLVDKFGFDTKQALHAYRILDFLERFAQNEFSDFGQAIYYDGHGRYEGKSRDTLLAIKCGCFSQGEFEHMVNTKLERVQDRHKSIYSEAMVDGATHGKLQDIVRGIVYTELMMR